jgi:uncharacterized protein
MNSANQTLSSLAQQLTSQRDIPPVEQWNPEYCGQMDLQIKANGQWFHEGSELTREKMKVLFSRIIKKEESRYYLVTPAEKIGINVEWQPFVIIDFNVVNEDGKATYLFEDNCGNHVLLKHPPQLQFSEFEAQTLPIILVRRNLYASFSRNCYYRLLEQAEIVDSASSQTICINSAGTCFELGKITNE